jgi:hypothetical protein
MALQPQLIGGLDGFAHSIASRFFEANKNRFQGNIELLDFGGNDCIFVFTRRIADIQERLKNENTYLPPGITLLAAAFDRQNIQRLVLLNEISRVLHLSLPGAQTISVTVLFPPQIAAESEKIATFSFFSKLEKMAYTVPFLKIFFINAIAHAIYESSGNVIPEENVLHELLYRQLMDAELNEVISSFGAKSIANQLQVAGRNGCYAVSGARKLVHLREACLNYLAARLQKDLLEERLFNIRSIAEDTGKRCRIQHRLDSFIQSQVVACQPAVADFLTENSLPKTPYNGMEELSECTKDVGKHIDRVAERLEDKKDEPSDETAPVMEEFQQVLLDESWGFAGAVLYLDALAGKRLPGETQTDDANPSGVDHFQALFYQGPLLSSAIGYLVPILEKYHSAKKVSIQNGVDLLSSFDAMRTKLSKAASVNSGTPVVGLISQCMEVLRHHLDVLRIELKDARETSNALLGLVDAYGGQIAARLEAVADARAATEAEFRSFKKEIGFWGRCFCKRKTYRIRLAEFKQACLGCEETSNALLLERAHARDLVMEMFERIIIPSTVRAFYNERFAGAAQSVIDQFLRYRSELDRVIYDRWEQVRKWEQTKTPILETVPDDTMIGVLYAQMKGKLPEAIDTVFRWRPGHLPNDKLGNLSYSRCQTAVDYYLAGVRALTDLFEDYVRNQLEPVKRLSILEVIETLGQDAAYAYVKNHLNALDKFLDLNSALKPLAYEGRKAQKIRVIRVDEPCRRRLSSSDYLALFESAPHWFTGNDDTVIDMTCFQFGLPAFAVHGLSECRDLFYKQESGEAGDLWPE